MIIDQLILIKDHNKLKECCTHIYYRYLSNWQYTKVKQYVKQNILKVGITSF